MINVEQLLNTIHEEVDKQNKATNLTTDPRLLTFKKGNKYRGRFVPRQKGTFVTFEDVGFTSRVTGNYVYLGRAWADPQLKNTGADIVQSTQWDEYKKAKASGNEELMKLTYKLIPQRKQLANFLLLDVDGDDSTAKEKIGQVVVVRYPAAWDKKEQKPRSSVYRNIYDGFFDEKIKKKIGSKGFLLPTTIEDGVDFVFDVIEKGGYSNYDNSKFDLIEDTQVKLEEAQILKMIENAHDLDELVSPLKTQEELTDLLNTHWFGLSPNPDDEVSDADSSSDSITKGLIDDGDDIPMDHSSSSSKTLDEELDEFLNS